MKRPVVRVFEKANQVSEDQWAELTTNPYESHAWFRANQEYFAGTRFLFFCAYEGTRLRAVMPVYDTHSTVCGDSARLLFRPAVWLLRRMSFLIVGSPLSFNSDVIGDRSMGGILASELQRHARGHRVDFLSFPFARRPLPIKGMFMRRSYHDHQLDLTGNSLDDYFASFQRKRRIAMKHELRSSAPCVRGPLEGNEELVAGFRNMSAARHGSRTAIPAEFYEILARHMGNTARVLLAGKEGDWRGALCYFVSGMSLYLFHAGVRDRDFSYFSLGFYEPIRIAYELGMNSINYRTGSSEAKVRRGCRQVPTTFCCKAVSLRARVLLALIKTALGIRHLARTT